MLGGGPIPGGAPIANPGGRPYGASGEVVSFEFMIWVR